MEGLTSRHQGNSPEQGCAWGFSYGPRAGDTWVLFPFRENEAVALTRKEWDDVAKAITSPTKGVVPTNFQLDKYKDKSSWHHDGQVDTEQIAILAAIRSGRLLRTEGDEVIVRDLDPDERADLVGDYRLWRDAAKVRRLHSRLAEAEGSSYTRAARVSEDDVRRAKLGKKAKIKAVYQPTDLLREVFGQYASYPDWEVFGEKAGKKIPMSTPVFYELDLEGWRLSGDPYYEDVAKETGISADCLAGLSAGPAAGGRGG